MRKPFKTLVNLVTADCRQGDVQCDEIEFVNFSQLHCLLDVPSRLHVTTGASEQENQYRKRLAKNVRAYRKKMALSQEALAERADMHWTFISGVERCKYNLSLSSLARIAKALGREPYELLKKTHLPFTKRHSSQKTG